MDSHIAARTATRESSTAIRREQSRRPEECRTHLPREYSGGIQIVVKDLDTLWDEYVSSWCERDDDDPITNALNAANSAQRLAAYKSLHAAPADKRPLSVQHDVPKDLLAAIDAENTQ